ncbi:MAG TPA: FxsA family protein [Polyangiaceae bacterium]|nr:FxsA family protein [Polyangiaceae bacterium]
MGLLFLAFTLVPLIELSLLIRIGRVIGAGNTLLFVIAMGVLGAVLAKRQGRRVLREWREAMAAGRVPEEGVLGGVLVIVGGLLLIAPGVLTDVAGLFCLVPATRRLIARALSHYLARRAAPGQVHNYGFEWPPRPPQSPYDAGPRSAPPRPRSEDVIDTEGEEIR